MATAPPKNKPPPVTLWDAARVARCQAWRQAGWTCGQIAEQLGAGVTPSAVYHALARASYRRKPAGCGWAVIGTRPDGDVCILDVCRTRTAALTRARTFRAGGIELSVSVRRLAREAH